LKKGKSRKIIGKIKRIDWKRGIERWKKVKREKVEWDNDKKGEIRLRKKEMIEWENGNEEGEMKYIKYDWKG
jgi:hypothetical protein